MIRKAIIKKNINTSEIHHVIGHNGSVFFKLFLIYFLVLAWFVLIYLVLDRYIDWKYLKRIFALLGLIALVKFCLDFFDLYLDSLVLVDTGIILYLWEWLLEYKTESFDRNKVESIEFNQKWIRDKLFIKWDITIRLEHWIEFPFENVSNPKRQAEKILQYKKRFTVPVIQEDPTSENDKKFDMLVEALWWVVKDYMERNNGQWEDKKEW